MAVALSWTLVLVSGDGRYFAESLASRRGLRPIEWQVRHFDRFEDTSHCHGYNNYINAIR